VQRDEPTCAGEPTRTAELDNVPMQHRRMGMKDNPIEQGWQRFLDKLKELWGKSGEPALAA